MFRRYLTKAMILAIAGVGLSTSAARAQIGVALTGAGPIDRSMGGAAVAAPLDASGALFWNPATMSGLSRSEMEFGAELLYPRTKVSSSIANLAGPDTNRSDAGIFPVPSFGLVYKPEESCWSFGLGLFGSGGFGVNYSASNTNVILTPQPPNGVGLGAVYSQFQILQLAPSASYQVNQHLSVGFSPTIDMAILSVEPDVFAPPNPNGAYSAATHGVVTWGLGCQAGVYYTTDAAWSFGAAVKSPQWLEPFRYNSTDAFGRPRTLKIHLDYPLMASLGASYTGFDRWLLAADLRYVDYRNTAGFQQTGFDKQGALRGLGWQSIFALALGAQYQWTDTIALRAGYSFNMNPEGNAVATYNLASPTIIQNTISLGASYDVTRALQLSVAYVHFFQNTIHGPIIEPSVGAVPGSAVRSTTAADSVVVGASVIF